MASSSTATSTRTTLSLSDISAPIATSDLSTVLIASVLTIYTSYTTSTYVSDDTTYKQSQGVLLVVTNSAEFSSLSAAGVFQITASSSTASTVSQTVKVTSSNSATASPSTPASQGASIGAGAGASIGIASIILILGLAGSVIWYLRRQRRMRSERRLLAVEVEVKPQLEDTSTAWKENIHIYKHELSAAQEVHELDARTGRVLAPELQAEPYSNRHVMEDSLERLQT